MRLVIISDTHGLHEQLAPMHGDVLIHCGDMGDYWQQDHRSLKWLDDWFGEQDFKRIFCTGGNHDGLLQRFLATRKPMFQNAEFLLDETVEYGGLTFHGSPWVPDLARMAFYASTDQLRAAWQKIPTGVDVLITHTPAFGIRDQTQGGMNTGCRELATALERIAPRVHCFGHAHYSHGQSQQGKTLFVNAALKGREARLINAPIVVNLEGLSAD